MKIAFYCPLKPISHPTPSGDREIARGLHSFLSRSHEVFILSEFRSRFFFWKPLVLLRWPWALARAYLLARREKPDLFFTYHMYYKAPDPIAFLLSWWFNKPYFIFEGMYASRPARNPAFWPGWLLAHGALKRARAVFSDKTDDLPALEKYFPGKAVYLPPSLDITLYSGIDIEEARKRYRSGKGPLVVTVAMLRPGRKTEGVEFLLRCLGRLAEKGLEFQWIHAGSGLEEAKVRALAEALLGAKARLLGGIGKREVAELLAAGDLFAFPGLDEGFGLVYLEAQVSGLPVVAFNNGGIPDAVGPGGILTPVNDEAAYTSALERLLTGEAFRLQMGEAGRDWVCSRFDREKNYAAMLRALE